MNHNRLYVLAVLAAHGPMHGHGIRRQAREERTELWSDVQAGSLYPALHKLASEELISPVRTEQVGKRPARTVYEITEEGHRELRLLWEEAFVEGIAPAPIELAVSYAGLFPPERVAVVLEDRRLALEAKRGMLERLHTLAEQHLNKWEKAAFRHHLRQIDTEIVWLSELLDNQTP